MNQTTPTYTHPYNYACTSINEDLSASDDFICVLNRYPQSVIKKLSAQFDFSEINIMLHKFETLNSLDYFIVVIHDAFGDAYNRLIEQLKVNTVSNWYDQKLTKAGTKIKTFWISLNGKRYQLLFFVNRYKRVLKVCHPDYDYWLLLITS